MRSGISERRTDTIICAIPFDREEAIEYMSPEIAIKHGKELQRLGEEVKAKQEELKCVRTNWRWRCPHCGNHLEDSFEKVLSKKEQHDKDLAAMEHLRKLRNKHWVSIRLQGTRDGQYYATGDGIYALPKEICGLTRNLADEILSIPIEEK